MFIVPLYSWTSLLFSVPLFLIEPIVILVLYLLGGSFTDTSNIYFIYLWNLVVAWLGLPIFIFMSVMCEFYLIISIIVGSLITLLDFIFPSLIYQILGVKMGRFVK